MCFGKHISRSPVLFLASLNPPDDDVLAIRWAGIARDVGESSNEPRCLLDRDAGCWRPRRRRKWRAQPRIGYGTSHQPASSTTPCSSYACARSCCPGLRGGQEQAPLGPAEARQVLNVEGGWCDVLYLFRGRSLHFRRLRGRQRPASLVSVKLLFVLFHPTLLPLF